MRRALAFLWAGAEAPAEYIVFRLSREWSCPPSVVRAQNAVDVYDTLTLLSAEAKVQKAGQR